MAQQRRVWQIPTILRELRRVTLEATEEAYDIMEPHTNAMQVTELIGLLKDHHMKTEMELPGQTSIPIEEE